MFTVTRTGRAEDMAASIRAVHTVAMPKAAAKALTFTAQAAQKSILAEMSSTFKGGATRYTLNSTRIESATVDKLSARVAVKDRTSGSGNLPENYLFPQVYGGLRKEKRFERAMRYSGLLKANERAVLGKRAPAEAVDSFGNIKYSEIKKILAATDAREKKATKGLGKRSGYFVGRVGKLTGVLKVVGKGEVVPMLVFVTKPPSFTKRLDFEAIARETAQREFEPTFRRLMAKEST